MEQLHDSQVDDVVGVDAAVSRWDAERADSAFNDCKNMVYLLGAWTSTRVLDSKFTRSAANEVDSLSAELTVAFSAFENFVPGGPPPESSFDLDSFIENTLNPLCTRFHEVKQVVDNLMMPPGQKKLRRSASDPIETKHAGRGGHRHPGAGRGGQRHPGAGRGQRHPGGLRGQRLPGAGRGQRHPGEGLRGQRLPGAGRGGHPEALGTPRSQGANAPFFLLPQGTSLGHARGELFAHLGKHMQAPFGDCKRCLGSAGVVSVSASSVWGLRVLGSWGRGVLGSWGLRA
eukprot:9483920-Pyramimonas_sp.AAC.1